MKTTIAMVCVALAVVILSAFAAYDALGFALVPADPASGRARGCYSTLERIAGVQKPTAVLRRTQLYCGVTGMMISACALGFSIRRKQP